MEPSVLKSTKKLLNIPPEVDAFDLDVLTQINAALSIANQIGVGSMSYYVADDSFNWGDFELPIDQLNLLKTFVFVKVKSFFDPDATSFTQEARQKQMDELTERLYIAANAARHPLPEEVA